MDINTVMVYRLWLKSDINSNIGINIGIIIYYE